MSNSYNTSKNLGQVKFVHVGSNPPARTTMLWLNTSSNPLKWYWYNNVTLAWELLNTLSAGSGDTIARIDDQVTVTGDSYTNVALIGKELLMVFVERFFCHLGSSIEDFSSFDSTTGKIQLNQSYPAVWRITVFFKL
jgi:hypothetical protein